MSQHDARIDGTITTSSGRAPRDAGADVFLELWALEMVARRSLSAAKASLALEAARLPGRLRAELETANARLSLMFAGVFTVVSTLIMLLDRFMPAWQAALWTSGIMAAVGVALLQERWVAHASALLLRGIRRDAARHGLVAGRELARVRPLSR